MSSGIVSQRGQRKLTPTRQADTVLRIIVGRARSTKRAFITFAAIRESTSLASQSWLWARNDVSHLKSALVKFHFL